MPSFRALQCSKTLATHVAVGMGAASFWRGAWYLLDDHLFPNNPTKSAMASLLLGVGGMAASQGLVARAEKLASQSRTKPLPLAVARFGALYTVAVSCVLVWRGTWVGWDVVYEKLHPDKAAKAVDPGHATHSGLLSHITAVSFLLGTGLFASVLAPPAAVSVIRDLAVRSSNGYQGPAQAIANQIWSRGRSLSTTTSTMSRKLMAKKSRAFQRTTMITASRKL